MAHKRMNELLDQVIQRYLDSRDFNGFYIHKETPEVIAAAVHLIKGGLVQAVDDSDYLNPHIRPWPSKRSIEDQIASVNGLAEAQYGLCLYPTPKAMANFDLGDRFKDAPYSRQMAEGRGTLELVYFRFDVLESYRNDPRFTFQFNDYGVDFWLNDNLYEDDAEPDEDKTSIRHGGFAYDLSKYDPKNPDSEVVRRVCAFFGDLRDLSPTHQLRWSTYQVSDSDNLRPHPIWWGAQMGHWPDGLGPFERFFFELKTWNELHKRVFGEDLLDVTDRPDDFGWILRPSKQEYDAFVHQMDKLLSENLRHKALDGLGAPRKDEADKMIGTLNRLDAALALRNIPEDRRNKVLEPIRLVRRQRQKPAHTITDNITDATFVHRQADLLQQVTDSLEVLRRFWQTHPENNDWEEPEYAAEDRKRYRL